MRVLAAFVVVAAGCGPVLPASDRVPVSGGHSTTQGDEGTRPGSDAPLHDEGGDTIGDGPKYDVGVASAEDDDNDGGGCPQTREVEPIESAIEVIVDVSQTMATTYVDHDEAPETEPITRWQMLSTALEQWLPVLGDQARLDMMMFPSIDALPPPSVESCESWIGPGLGTPAQELLGELPPATATFMQGANPMDLALANAQSVLQEVDDSAKRTIVVLTDGAPNCSESLDPPERFDLVNEAARGWTEYALGLGISTYVVAIAVPQGEYGGTQGEPFANHRYELETIANAGGTALLYGQRAWQLDESLGFVVQQARSCRASVPVELLGVWLTVEVAGLSFGDLGGATYCYGDPGFVYVDDGLYSTIELCGTACDLFLEQGSATLVEQCAFPE